MFLLVSGVDDIVWLAHGELDLVKAAVDRHVIVGLYLSTLSVF